MKLEVTPDAPRIVVDVSYVRKIHHQRYFLWQAQYLVMVEGDSCCPAPCIGVSCVTNRQRHFPWQVQYLVKLEGDSGCSAHCTGHFMCDEDQS